MTAPLSRRLQGRCALCGSPFDPACLWCVGRADRLRPLSPTEAIAWAENARQMRNEAAATVAAASARSHRLATLGRAVRVGLVGCAKQKREGVHQARDLYTSPLFRLALRVAELTCDEVFILSALHELVELAQPVRSYDRRIADLDKQLRALWGARVSLSLEHRFGEFDVELHIFAGNEYLRRLRLPSHGGSCAGRAKARPPTHAHAARPSVTAACSARARRRRAARERGGRYAVEQLERAGAEQLAKDQDPRAWLRQQLPRVARTLRHPGNHKWLTAGPAEDYSK